MKRRAVSLRKPTAELLVKVEVASACDTNSVSWVLVKHEHTPTQI